MADYTTIDNPFKHFNTVLYTGNGGSSLAVTGVGFQPDWVWLKSRSDTEQHTAWDSVRGGSKRLMPDDSAAEYDNSTQGLQSFDSDGFTCGDSDQYNKSSQNVASWNWLGANGTTSNSDGSITSTISANPTAGFCICSWTGDGSDATIGHGLGAVPKMIIHKHRSGSVQWNVYHVGAGTGGYLRLDGTGAFTSNSGFFGTAPTSSVFSPGSHSYMSGSGNDNIAYIFADVQGYSKFFSYEGNSNSDGTFVYLGFKPAWIMVKPIDAADNWVMFDNKRHNAINSSVSPYLLYANRNFAETTDTKLVDFVSNGFKIRSSGNTVNRSSTFIGMAFAEAPFVTAGTKAAGTAR